MESHAQGRLLIVEDLYALPDDGLRHELLAGHLLSEPLPGARHGWVTAAIVELLRSFVRSRSLGVVLTADAGFILARTPDTLRGPDVAFVSKKRFDEIEDKSGAFPGPPDLAVEVLSPHDRPGDVHAKVADYLVAGTRLVWVVDPQNESVTVYRTLLAPRLFETTDDLDGGDVLPGFTVRVAKLFEV